MSKIHTDSKKLSTKEALFQLHLIDRFYSDKLGHYLKQINEERKAQQSKELHLICNSTPIKFTTGYQGCAVADDEAKKIYVISSGTKIRGLSFKKIVPFFNNLIKDLFNDLCVWAGVIPFQSTRGVVPFTKIVEQVADSEQYDDFEVIFIGHSLGAVHAQLGAIYFNHENANKASCVAYEDPGCENIISKFEKAIHGSQKQEDHFEHEMSCDREVFHTRPVNMIVQGNVNFINSLDASAKTALIMTVCGEQDPHVEARKHLDEFSGCRSLKRWANFIKSIFWHFDAHSVESLINSLEDQMEEGHGGSDLILFENQLVGHHVEYSEALFEDLYEHLSLAYHVFIDYSLPQFFNKHDDDSYSIWEQLLFLMVASEQIGHLMENLPRFKKNIMQAKNWATGCFLELLENYQERLISKAVIQNSQISHETTNLQDDSSLESNESDSWLYYYPKQLYDLFGDFHFSLTSFGF